MTKNITVNVDDTIYIKLQKIAKEQDRSIASIVRKALNEVYGQVKGEERNTSE